VEQAEEARVNADPWSRFIDLLSARFQDLAPGDTVILSRGRHFVQLAHVVDEVHAEAVGDAGLPPDQRLTDDQQRRLAELGWHPPAPPGYVNYWHRILAPPAPSDSRRLATLFADTLREVYGVESPEALDIEAWNDETGERIQV
jgi:hypothetical protein